MCADASDGEEETSTPSGILATRFEKDDSQQFSSVRDPAL
jgi:hypothetical protein